MSNIQQNVQTDSSGNVGIGRAGLAIEAPFHVHGGEIQLGDDFPANALKLRRGAGNAFEKNEGAGWVPVSNGTISGGGTTNRIPIWTGAAALGDSQIGFDSGNTRFGFLDGAGTPGTAFDIQRNQNAESTFRMLNNVDGNAAFASVLASSASGSVGLFAYPNLATVTKFQDAGMLLASSTLSRLIIRHNGENGGSPTDKLVTFAGQSFGNPTHASLDSTGYFGFNVGGDAGDFTGASGGSPAREKLHFHHNLNSPVGMRFTNAATGRGVTDGTNIRILTGGDFEFWNYENTDMIWGTNNTQQMHLHTVSRRLGLFDAASSPAYSLHTRIDQDTSTLILTQNESATANSLAGLGALSGTAFGFLYALNPSSTILTSSYQNNVILGSTSGTSRVVLNSGKFGTNPEDGRLSAETGLDFTLGTLVYASAQGAGYLAANVASLQASANEFGFFLGENARNRPILDRLHLHHVKQTGIYTRYTNANTSADTSPTTNPAATDGFRTGIMSDGVADIWQFENLDMRFGVGNSEFMRIIQSTGNLRFADAKNLEFNATTGTKIGTASSQKFAFWGKAPIVQPTTGIAAAAFVANTSGIVDDTATFGGYTLGQIAQALINVGILQ